MAAAADMAAPVRPTPVSRYVPLTQLQRTFLWLFIFSYCFDFAGPVGGSPIQFVYLAISLTSFCLFFVTVRVGRASHGMRFITGYWWLYLVITLITNVIGTMTGTIDVFIDTYGRVMVPYLNIGLALLISRQLEASGANPEEIFKPLILCGLISAVWHMYFGLEHSGEGFSAADIDNIRFQILSPAEAMLVAFGLVGVLAKRRITLLAVLALCLSVTAILLSITREYILTGLLCYFTLIVCTVRESGNKPGLASRFVGRSLAFCVFAFILFGLAIIIRPNTITQWNVRLAAGGTGGSFKQDPTTLIRESEISWDWNAINSNPQYLLTGKGVGAYYNHDPSYEKLLPPGIEMPDQQIFSPADCQWAYAMFSSGLIFGGMMLGIFFLPLYRVFLCIWRREAVNDPHMYDMKLVIFVVLAAQVSLIFSSAPTGDRLYGILMGLIVGLAYWKSAPSRITSHTLYRGGTK